MSTLNVTTISDGTNSTSTTNVVKGSAKAWVIFNGTGTVAIRESYNVGSITDNGTGRYTVNFNTAMPDANYATMTTGKMTSAVTNGGSVTSVNDGQSGIYTTSGVSVISLAVSGNEADTSIYSVAIFR